MQQLIEFIGHHALLSGGAAVALMVVAAYEFRTGVQGSAALSAMQAVRLMNQGALVIDLRGKELYEAGHIGEARNIPLATLESQGEALRKWRDKPVIAYCGSGRDGAVAARTLQKLGFTKAFSLAGGLDGWIKDNMPVAKA
jgi:rhodanese-related sulfurtransferase